MFRILSIDAWSGDEPGTWEWNNWHHVGDIETIPEKDEDIISLMIDEGYLTDYARDKVIVEDDQYNLVITHKESNEPVFAIEYGDKNDRL